MFQRTMVLRKVLLACLRCVLHLVLALQLRMCIEWIPFHIRLRFPHFWLLFWRSGFSNWGTEKEAGSVLGCVFFFFFLANEFYLILKSVILSSLFKVSEFDLDLLPATLGNGLWREIWAQSRGVGGISATGAACARHLSLEATSLP